MLERIIKNNEEVIEMVLRAKEGCLKIDLENKKILNESGLANHYYNKLMKEAYTLKNKNPALYNFSYFIYWTFHPIKNLKAKLYLDKLLKEHKKK